MKEIFLERQGIAIKMANIFRLYADHLNCKIHAAEAREKIAEGKDEYKQLRKDNVKRFVSLANDISEAMEEVDFLTRDTSDRKYWLSILAEIDDLLYGVNP